MNNPEEKITKLCECGCGQIVKNIKNRFINRHNKPYLFVTSASHKKISESLKGHSGYWLGKKRTDQWKQSIYKANKGRKHTLESRLKMSKSMTGIKKKKHTLEHNLKISKNHKGMLGRKHTLESRLKMSLASIKYLEDHNYSPRRGKNEDYILDQLQNQINKNILRNDINLAYKSGKPTDGFIEIYNLVIEVLEPWHFQINGELSNYDKTRELLIASRLGCMIYYIPEQEFLNNPNKEIQRFKDFLMLLE